MRFGLAIMKASDASERDERTSAPGAWIGDSDIVFENLFKRKRRRHLVV
jgi:hypothetical protein